MASLPVRRPSEAPGPPPVQSAPPELHRTDHLKQVPESRADRERLRNAAISLASQLDKSRPLGRPQLEAHARTILATLGLPDGYVGWTMVALGTAFWRDQVMAVPFSRRLLLLPHCLRDTEACPAEYDEFGLRCEDCGACRLTWLREFARNKGYRVLIAEGSPIVMEIILAGHVDAVLGVACLDSLEKALDKILLVGLPSMAVPLWASTCRHTSTDEDWVREMVGTPYCPGRVHTRSYVHLLRCAVGMFRPGELERLVPGSSGLGAGGRGLGTRTSGLQPSASGLQLAASRPGNSLDPLVATEVLAHDFLLKGGKRFRPFITLATFDAMTGGCGSGPDGADRVAQIPDAVRRVALAMEVFHKASLVHDDVEDDDPFRYGHPTLHRTYGTPTAINVGDYLIGLGYRLIASERRALGAEAVADILARLGDAHTRLCEGQGAELAWREGPRMDLAPLEALKIYALKTAPAFEAALYAGIRLAEPAEPYRPFIARFARHLGIAFQILNDLDDWDQELPSKRSAGTDVAGGRPTVLWALALQGLSGPAREELESMAAGAADEPEAAIRRVRQLYQQAGVFDKAAGLVARHRDRARRTADDVPHRELRALLHYFVDTVVPRSKYEG